MSMKYKLNRLLKHPGYNGGGGGGGGGPAPVKYAPAFGGVAPTAPTVPVAPTSPSQFNASGDFAGMYRPQQYNPYQPQYGARQPSYDRPIWGGPWEPPTIRIPEYGNPYAQPNMWAMDQATQQYNQFGPRTMQYGLAQGQYGRDYGQYRQNVNQYNQQVQEYTDQYGTGYSGYNAPSTITASPYGVAPPSQISPFVGKGAR